MAPSPAPWAVLGDVLWCLGLGCLLGAARDAVRLALGEGPVRCFFRDIAVFAAAAVLVGFGLGLTPPRPVRRALAWLSALTYSFYLWHQQLTLFLKYDLHLPVWSGDTPPNQLGDTAWMQQAHALYWTAAIAVTLAAYYGVEKPIAKRLHGKKG